MEFEPWWLLALPIFFALGWFAARADLRQLARESKRLPDAYFRGLNFLLNEESDRAIDAFVDVVRLDPDAAELHFALGNLFRRRGETDRAIRVHQHLAGRSDLAPKVRQQAHFELGQDYLKAGLLDRAEAAFDELSGGALATRALLCRLEIAQTERDWARAIGLAEEFLALAPARLEPTELAARDRVLAASVHFYCEQACDALNLSPQADCAGAERALASAARQPQGTAHPRVWELRAELAQRRGDSTLALQAWQSLASGQPDYLAPFAERALQHWEAAGQLKQGLEWLERCRAAVPASDLLCALAQARARLNGAGEAAHWLTGALQQTPSLLGLECLLGLRAQARHGNPDGAETVDPAALPVLDDALVRGFFGPQVQRLARYRCGQCGFEGRRFHWHCPGCNRWDSFAPRRIEEIPV